MLVAFTHLTTLLAAGTPAIVAPAPPPIVIVEPQPPAPPVIVNVAPLVHQGPLPLVIPKGTRVVVEIDAPMASNTSVPATRFPIHLAEDVVVDGYRLMMAGATGEGEIVHAAKAGWGGKAGELIINARFLDCDSVRLPIGKMRISGRGANNLGEAWAATMVFSPAGFFVSGGNLSVTSGTRADAATLADLPLATIEGTRCSVPANSSTSGVK